MNKEVGFITIYTSAGLHHSQESALAWYSKRLILGMNEESRQKLIVFSNIKNTKQIFIEDEVEVNECWQRNKLSFVGEIISEIKKHPDLKVIHIQHEFNLFGGPVSILLYLHLLRKIKKLKKKIVVTYHGVIPPRAIGGDFNKINQLNLPNFLIRVFFRFIYRWSAKYINKTIVHAEYFKKILTDAYGFQSDQIEAIPYGIDEVHLKMSREEARKRLNISEDKKVLLFFGFLAGYKGIDLLIEAFQGLDPKENILILAGDKPRRVENDVKYNSWYRSMTEKVKGIPNIFRVGFVPDRDVEIYFQACDVLIMPYLQLFGISGPMSMSIAYQKPFLMSDIFQDVMSNKSIIFKRNPDDLVKKIEEFFQDKHQFDNYIRVLKDERSWHNAGKKTFEIYKTFIKNKI